MTLPDADRREVVRIAEAAALRAARDMLTMAPTTGLLTLPSWVGATVASDAEPYAQVDVKIDGDEATSVAGAQNATGLHLNVRQRVMVLVRPSKGALVVGTLDGVAWQTWTPQLVQNGNKTSTIDYAYVARIGDLIVLQGRISNLGVGTAANIIAIEGLPYEHSGAAVGQMGGALGALDVGTFNYLDSGSASYDGTVLAAAALSTRLIFKEANTISGSNLGVAPSLATAAADVFSFEAVYRTISA